MIRDVGVTDQFITLQTAGAREFWARRCDLVFYAVSHWAKGVLGLTSQLGVLRCEPQPEQVMGRRRNF